MTRTGMDPDGWEQAKPKRRKVYPLDVAQQSIFALPQPPSVPIDTSENAADLIFETGTAAWMRVQALRCFVARDKGLTDAELQDALGLTGQDSNRVRPRRWELEQQGLIRRDDTVTRKYKDRQGTVHQQAHPYVSTEKGERCLRGLAPWPWGPKRK